MFIGLAVWLVVSSFVLDQQRYLINIQEADAAPIAVGMPASLVSPPTPEELRGLIDRYVADKIAHREGMVMALDQNDGIVRRRIVQKYRLLSTGQEVPAEPTEGMLAHWFRMHEVQYRDPGRTSFVHIYFIEDNKRGGNAHCRGTCLKFCV